MDIHIIFHKDISRKKLDKIANLKNSEWKYGRNSNFFWLKNNIYNKDLHILIMKNHKLIAYNCLRLKEYINLDNKIKNIYIFDSMIVEKKFRNKGFGGLINDINKLILKKYKIPGFLICNKKNIQFYKKNGWSIYKKNYLKLNNHFSKKSRMTFNLKLKEKIKCIFY